MKKLILYLLVLLLLAATFMTESPPPGWYQQSLPVNDQINDIFFLDSLTGWVVTAGASSSTDTAYILKTLDAGSNWTIQTKGIFNFVTIQFLNVNTGFCGAINPTAKIFKTTNSGNNWFIADSILISLKDLFFVNVDTGWICDDNPLNGGIFKTTNGGINWFLQAPQNYRPQKLFFINRDTGWAGSSDWKLYRTTNGGNNWGLQYTSNSAVSSIFFINGLKGWIRGGIGNGVMYTTDGGLNWSSAQGDPAGYDLKFINDSIGYSGMIDFKIMKSTDGGKTWGYQNSPIISNLSVSILKTDAIHGWAGGIGFIKTTDGGGPITYNGIKSSYTFVTAFELKQNYPNPFNPSTTIEFYVQKPSRISLKIFTIQGREISGLLDYEKFDAGYTYYAEFNAGNLSSGVYLYQMTGWTLDKKEIFIDTKKMILLK